MRISHFVKGGFVADERQNAGDYIEVEFYFD